MSNSYIKVKGWNKPYEFLLGSEKDDRVIHETACDVTEIHLSYDVLEEARRQLVGLPDRPGKVRVTWFGDQAKFIASNLSLLQK